jgi:hypothetical protein
MAATKTMAVAVQNDKAQSFLIVSSLFERFVFGFRGLDFAGMIGCTSNLGNLRWAGNTDFAGTFPADPTYLLAERHIKHRGGKDK